MMTTTNIDQRDAAIERIREIEATYADFVEPYNTACVAADEKRTAAKQAFDAAERAFIEARGARLSAIYPRDNELNRLRSGLEGKLRPAALVTALDEVEALRNRVRVRGGSSEDYVAIGEVLRWCDSARAELLAMQYQAGAITLDIEALMAGKPNV